MGISGSGQQLLLALVMSCVGTLVTACDRSFNHEESAWRYPRVINRDDAERLLHEAQVSARGTTSERCTLNPDLGHNDQLISQFVLLQPKDIVDYGQAPGEISMNLIAILLAGPEWPEEGIWLHGRIKDKHCLQWAVSRATRIEQRR